MKQVTYDKMVKIRSGSTRPDKGKWDVTNLVRF